MELTKKTCLHSKSSQRSFIQNCQREFEITLGNPKTPEFKGIFTLIECEEEEKEG